MIVVAIAGNSDLRPLSTSRNCEDAAQQAKKSHPNSALVGRHAERWWEGKRGGLAAGCKGACRGKVGGCKGFELGVSKFRS